MCSMSNKDSVVVGMGILGTVMNLTMMKLTMMKVTTITTIMTTSLLRCVCSDLRGIEMCICWSMLK